MGYAFTDCCGNAMCYVQNKARLDITRLQRLSSGLGSFTTDGIRSTQPGAATPALDNTSREILRMIFDRDGSYLQVSPIASTHSATPGGRDPRARFAFWASSAARLPGCKKTPQHQRPVALAVTHIP